MVNVIVIDEILIWLDMLSVIIVNEVGVLSVIIRLIGNEKDSNCLFSS